MAMTISQRREAYRADYLRMFAAAKIDPNRAKEAAATADAIRAGKARYDIVSAATGVPWWFIGLCHDRECSLSWKGTLHNGEMIIGTDRVTHLVPAGRGPFKTWEDGAIDAMRYEGFDKIPVWDETECLLRLEAYNGFGYRGHGVPSPYLWAGTNQTDGRGKYVRDGVFDSNAIDRQLGCVAVMLALRDMGFALFPGDGAAKTDVADKPHAAVIIPQISKPKPPVIVPPNTQVGPDAGHVGAGAAIVASAAAANAGLSGSSVPTAIVVALAVAAVGLVIYLALRKPKVPSNG